MSGFRSATQVLESALKVCDRSESLRGVRECLPGLLALADRHAIACQADLGLAKAAKVAELFGKTTGKPPGRALESEGDLGEELLAHLEPWLKSVLRFADQSSYFEAEQKPRTFNLYGTFKRLGLLTKVELEMELADWNKLPDRARGCLLLAKEERNDAIHNLADQDLEVARMAPTARILTVLAALYTHRRALQHGLRALVTRAVDLPEAELAIVHAMRAERERHLARFGGREQVIADLRGLVDVEAKPAWIAVVATAGMGKSALAAAFSQGESSVSSSIGPGALGVRFVAPWLPGCLLHLGKQSKSELDATNGLLAQASSLLLESLPRVALGEGSTRFETDWQAEFDQRIEPRDEAHCGLTRDPRYRGSGTVKIHTRGSGVHDRCRAAIQAALVRLVEERGAALLIVDGLDEIPDFGDGHAWLPRELPEGSHAIVFSRDNAALARFVDDRPGVKRVALEGLNRQEIAEVLGPKVENFPEFLDEVMAKTCGWPTEVAPLRDEIDREGDPRKVRVRRRQESLKQLASVWVGDSVTEKLLEVLAAFEPCGPLPVDALQGWLDYRGVQLRRHNVDAAIDRIADQVSGREADQLRLALGPFAEYLRSTHYSRRDWREILLAILSWVERDESVEVRAASGFLAAWSREEECLVPGIPELPAALRNCLSTPRGGAILWESVDTLGRDDRSLVFARRCWELGHPEAGAWVARALLHGRGCRRNQEEGLRLLYQAAESCPSVKLQLAETLIEGRGVSQDAEVGFRLLEEAAESDHSARTQLAERLIDGRGVPRDVGRGVALLREVAKLSADAKRRLGERLIDGDGVQQNVEEGLQLLRETAQSSGFAKERLGARLIDGTGVLRDPKGGLRLLREAAESDKSSAFRLAERLIDGDGVPKDAEEGLKLLRGAAESNAFFQGRLGERLLDGHGVQPDPGEGLRLLRKASESSDFAKERLSERLLNGQGVAMDAEEGLRLLQELADSDEYFKSRLADRLLDGDGVPRDANEGLKLLRELAESSESALMELADRLIDGDGVPKDAEEGLGLLRKAAASAALAKGNLGERLIDGAGVPKDMVEGLSLLREAAKSSAFAMGRLGERLIDGNGLLVHPEEGLELLKEAAKSSEKARLALCRRLLSGEGIPKDQAEALRLARMTRGGGDCSHTVLLNLGFELFGRDDPEDALVAFLALFEDGGCGNNAAYLLRRGLAKPPGGCPTIPDLLARGTASADPVPVVNSALYEISVNPGDDDTWKRSSVALSGLTDASDVTVWWGGLAENDDDPEGHLVLALLLTYHKGNVDGRGLSAREHFEKARAGGWPVPDWMLIQ